MGNAFDAAHSSNSTANLSLSASADLNANHADSSAIFSTDIKSNSFWQ